MKFLEEILELIGQLTIGGIILIGLVKLSGARFGKKRRKPDVRRIVHDFRFYDRTDKPFLDVMAEEQRKYDQAFYNINHLLQTHEPMIYTEDAIAKKMAEYFPGMAPLEAAKSLGYEPNIAPDSNSLRLTEYLLNEMSFFNSWLKLKTGTIMIFESLAAGHRWYNVMGNYEPFAGELGNRGRLVVLTRSEVIANSDDCIASAVKAACLMIKEKTIAG